MSGNEAPSGLMRVAAPADFFDSFPMDRFVDFLAQRPQVRVDVVLGDTSADLITDRIGDVRGDLLSVQQLPRNAADQSE